MTFLCLLWIVFQYLPVLSQVARNDHRQPDQVEVSFEVVNAGFHVSGTFKSVSCQITFYPEALSQSRVRAYADAGSIYTGITLRDRHLKGTDYFDVSRYPGITLESLSFRRQTKRKFIGTFQLTIKDQVRQVEIPFTISTNERSQTFKGQWKINRLDYNIGTSSAILQNEVTISFEVTRTSGG